MPIKAATRPEIQSPSTGARTALQSRGQTKAPLKLEAQWRPGKPQSAQCLLFSSPSQFSYPACRAQLHSSRGTNTFWVPSRSLVAVILIFTWFKRQLQLLCWWSQSFLQSFWSYCWVLNRGREHDWNAEGAFLFSQKRKQGKLSFSAAVMIATPRACQQSLQLEEGINRWNQHSHTVQQASSRAVPSTFP